MRARDVLPDILESDLAVVFVGEAVGMESAQAGHYYADPRNSFWKDLVASQVTPQRFSPRDDKELPRYGIGLTDVLKRLTNEDLKKGIEIPRGALAEARTNLKEKLRLARPLAVCFLGRDCIGLFFDGPRAPRRNWGKQKDLAIGTSAVWLMPSTSGAAGGSGETRLRVLREIEHQVVGPWQEQR